MSPDKNKITKLMHSFDTLGQNNNYSKLLFDNSVPGAENITTSLGKELLPEDRNITMHLSKTIIG